MVISSPPHTPPPKKKEREKKRVFYTGKLYGLTGMGQGHEDCVLTT